MHDSFVFNIIDQNYPVGYANLINDNGAIKLADIYIYDHAHAKSTLARWFKKLRGRKNYRDKGVGTCFLKRIIKFCKNKGTKKIYGELVDDIPRLKKWYQSLGFTIDTTNKIELDLSD